jgi:ArsR family transcriptional regulator
MAMATAASTAPAPGLDTTRAANLFHALSDPIRIDVVNQLLGGERCVCELTADLEMAQSRLSWHLKTLVDAGIISSRRQGRWNYYAVNAGAIEEAREILASFRPGRRLIVKANCC